MRIPLIAANWKMYKTSAEARAFVREFVPLVSDVHGVEIVIAPPFTSLSVVAEAAAATAIGVAAQNLYFEREGAFTGEVSAAMVRDAGAGWVLVGHSERRRQFGESDDWVNRKTRAALDAGLAPIVCVGETLKEREAGHTEGVLDRQIERGLAGFAAEAAGRLVIAYEPVWAIGTGKNATPAEADAAHRHIRGRLSQAFGHAVANACRILYGGSVKPANALSLLALPDVDGALVGGASLGAGDFAEIVRAGVVKR
jgi:triosephosphate isomerase (TIM)